MEGGETDTHLMADIDVRSVLISQASTKF